MENYHAGLGKLYKWLITAISGRKADITRRLIATRKAREDRQNKIEKEEDRKIRREDYIIEKKNEWETDNAEGIEAYQKFKDRERRREAGEPVSEDEDEDEGEEGKEKEPPVQPVFDEEECFAKFDEKEENAIVEIPDEIVNQVDDDWPMLESEKDDLVDKVLASREVV